MTGPSPHDVPYQAHIDLLRCFLAHREEIIERIEGVLNAQRKPLEYLRDGPLLSRHFERCFFTLPALTPSQVRLQGQLDAAHRAGPFRPRPIPGLYNGLVDASEMMMRGFHLWRETRWPGRPGRIRYAHTLFNLYVLRCLELLTLHMWGETSNVARERLAQAQEVLDRLWTHTPPDQPVLVRDARWLIQLAQSPATDELGAYFDVAEQIAATLAEEDRIAIHSAGVRMAGGHLRSQTRYHSTKRGMSRDEQSLILTTRDANALDFALLIQELVPLLEAYEHACHRGDHQARLELADAVCQGISPDPELFVNHVALLGAYSMLEHLFVATASDGRIVQTEMGRRHLRLLQEYEERIGRMSKPLADDCAHFRPVAGSYSPYGVLFGFTTNLVEHMAFKTLQPDAVTPFSLEDVFTSGDRVKLAWVSHWRKLPHLTPEVSALFDYPQQFAEDAFARVEQALHTRATDGAENSGSPPGRLLLIPAADGKAESDRSLIPDLPVRYIRSSDSQLVAACRAEAYDETTLLRDRREGKFVVSYRTAGGWVGIAKALLTEVLGAGRDAKAVGLPAEAADALKLLYPDLVVLHDEPFVSES